MGRFHSVYFKNLDFEPAQIDENALILMLLEVIDSIPIAKSIGKMSEKYQKHNMILYELCSNAISF